jgi:hypothetical protein
MLFKVEYIHTSKETWHLGSCMSNFYIQTKLDKFSKKKTGELLSLLSSKCIIFL